MQVYMCRNCGRNYGTDYNTPVPRCICGSEIKEELTAVKTNWSLLKEFVPILKECADVMTHADNGKHPRNSFLKEDPDHQLECMSRHIYEDAYVDPINLEDGGYHHLAHAIIRLLMYYRIKQVRGKSIEEVR